MHSHELACFKRHLEVSGITSCRVRRSTYSCLQWAVTNVSFFLLLVCCANAKREA